MIESAISTILKGSTKQMSAGYREVYSCNGLTNKVLLTSSHLQANKTNDTRHDCQSTECERKGDTSGALEHASCQKHSWNCVHHKVASQVECEVEDKGLRCIENGTGAIFLTPLNRDVCAAEESVIEENGEIASNDEASHAIKHLPHARVRR